jgi:hypothetical protein
VGRPVRHVPGAARRFASKVAEPVSFHIAEFHNDGGASNVVNSYGYNKRRLLVGETQAQSDASETWSIGYGYSTTGA